MVQKMPSKLKKKPSFWDIPSFVRPDVGGTEELHGGQVADPVLAEGGQPRQQIHSKPASPDVIRFGNIILTLDLSSICFPDLSRSNWAPT